MRAFNIVVLVVVLIMLFVTGYYIDEVSSAHQAGFFNDHDYGYGSFRGSYYGFGASSLTETAVLIMLVFAAFLAAGYVGNLIKVKTVTSRVMCITGLSFTFLILIINLAVMTDSEGLSFDESGGFSLFMPLLIWPSSLYCWCSLSSITTGRTVEPIAQKYWTLKLNNLHLTTPCESLTS